MRGALISLAGLALVSCSSPPQPTVQNPPQLWIAPFNGTETALVLQATEPQHF
jgi:hypothetical protein